MRKRGPWTIHEMRTAFENPWMQVVEHVVTQPDGTPGNYGVVSFRNLAIGVLPLDAEGNVLLVGQHRFPNDYYSWELPEGGGARDVAPVESAKRELREETGAAAENWREFLRMDMSNSITDEIAIGFLAWGLSSGKAEPDPTEVLETRRAPFREVLEMCLSGEIRDSLTIAMVTTAQIKAARGDFPDDVAALILR